MFTNRPHGTDVKRFKGLTPEIQFWQPIHTWIYREEKTKPRPSTWQNLPFSSALVSHNLRMHSEINRDVDFGLGFKIRFWSRFFLETLVLFNISDSLQTNYSVSQFFFTPVKFSKKNFFPLKNFNQKFYAYCTFISTWNHPVLFNYLWLWQSYARSTVTIQRFYISIETHTRTHTRPFFRDNPGEPVPER